MVLDAFWWNGWAFFFLFAGLSVSWSPVTWACLILFWKVDGSRPFSDSSFPIVEMKGSLLALLTIYRWRTSHLSCHRSSCSLIFWFGKTGWKHFVHRGLLNYLLTGNRLTSFWCETNICLRANKQCLLWTLMDFSPHVSSDLLERQIWCWKLQFNTQLIVGELLVTCPVTVS